MRRLWLLALPLLLAGCVTDSDGTYTYKDALRPHGHARGEAALQRDTSRCDPNGQKGYETSAFDACMRSRGWRFDQFQPAPQDDSDDDDSASTPSSDDSSSSDDENAAIDQMNQQNADDEAQQAAEQQNEAAQQQFLQDDTNIANSPQVNN